MIGIAEQLAESHYHLLINDIIPPDAVMPKLEALRQRGIQVIYTQADVSRSDDRQQFLDA